MTARGAWIRIGWVAVWGLCMASLAFSQTMEKEIFGTYSWREHIDPDGRPSRVDHRYRSESITLERDSTFQMVIQRGRLSPNHGYKKGVWHVENDTVLVCNVQFEKVLNPYPMKDDAAQEWVPSREVLKFVVDRRRLYDQWEDRYYN
jgi:hypothetical protein